MTCRSSIRQRRGRSEYTVGDMRDKWDTAFPL